MRLRSYMLPILLLTLMSCKKELPENLPDCFLEINDFEAVNCPGEGICSFTFYTESQLISKNKNHHRLKKNIIIAKICLIGQQSLFCFFTKVYFQKK